MCGDRWERTDLELMRSRHLDTNVSQLSVKASISIRSWIHCSLLAGVNKPANKQQTTPQRRRYKRLQITFQPLIVLPSLPLSLTNRLHRQPLHQTSQINQLYYYYYYDIIRGGSVLKQL